MAAHASARRHRVLVGWAVRLALALAFACCGCEAIDDVSRFHVVAPDGGALADAALGDLAGLAPDAATEGDGAAADLSMPAAVGDLAGLDLAAPDLAVPDLAVPDLAAVDLVAPDLAAPDLTVADLASPDLAQCGVCSPGQQLTMPCGNCGTETITCLQSCQWSVGVCNGQGACAPGAQRSVACGNCGMKTDTCGMDCQWSPGACNGQGCAPGSTQAGGCDQCSQQTCGNDCKWSACGLKPGNTCEYQGGGNTQQCPCASPSHPGCNPSPACQGPATRSCLNTCQWAACTCQCQCNGGSTYCSC